MFTRNHTVDKAIAPLLKAQSDLEAVTVERSALIGRNEVKIDELMDDNGAAATERERAYRIAAALKKITDPEDISRAIRAITEPTDPKE